MTTIDECLGRCVVRVDFQAKRINNMPEKCRTCTGLYYQAVMRDCEHYKPYIAPRGRLSHLVPNRLPGGISSSDKKEV